MMIITNKVNKVTGTMMIMTNKVNKAASTNQQDNDDPTVGI